MNPNDKLSVREAVMLLRGMLDTLRARFGDEQAARLVNDAAARAGIDVHVDLVESEIVRKGDR